MSTGSPGSLSTDQFGHPTDTQVPAGVPPDSSRPADVDQALIQQTKQQIRVLVQEITQLSQSNVGVEDFYHEFLPRVVSALASIGGAIWVQDSDGTIQLQYQINLQASGLVDGQQLQARHALLLKKVLDGGVATLVPPQSGSSDEEESGNPTDNLLILAPIQTAEQTFGVVEIFQRAGGGPTTQRGYLRFLVQMCELANEFFRSRRLRVYTDRQKMWERLEHFLDAIHSSLDLTETCYTVANEAHALLEADRVSVALAHGHHCKLEAVSGLDSIDRRAAAVKRLSKLVSVVVAADEPLWYTGGEQRLPPQVEKALYKYIDESHSKIIGILPLHECVTEGESSKPGKLLGALVIEQLKQSRIDDGFVGRSEAVAHHSARAIANSAAHSRLFLLPLWRAIGSWQWMFQTRSLPKTVGVLALLVALVWALIYVPREFNLPAQGKLHPVHQGEIFAPLEGTVIDVPVHHGKTIQQGEPLVRLRNADLELQYTKLLGQRNTKLKQISNMQRALLEDALSPAEQDRVSGELAELRQAAHNIELQLTLLDEKKQQLEIRSPLSGEVVTWKVYDKLMHRPVQRGQVLMTVIDPNRPWELELYMPERYMGHISRAASTTTEDRGLMVSFMLSSHPEQTFYGQVSEIHRSAHVHDTHGNSVILKVAIDRNAIPQLRSETTVSAKIHCGNKPIGYVWFHDLIETVYAKVLFWI